MRKCAEVYEPIEIDGYLIKRIMVCDLSNVILFFYDTKEDFFSVHSMTFDDLPQAEEYLGEIGMIHLNWRQIDEPLEGCNLDWIAPVRRKGRCEGTYYSSDAYERLEHNVWVDFFPFD